MILAINSSTLQHGIAFIADDGSVISEYISPEEEKGFTGFMPALDALFVSSGIDRKEISAIAVAIGPGSFTGLRVGLSAAKGLAYGLNVPVIGISGTKALASQVSPAELKICSMITSRKGEVFYALFSQDDQGGLIRFNDDTSVNLRHLGESVKGPSIFIGNDYLAQAGIIKEVLGDRAELAPANAWCLKASSVGMLGLKRFRKGDFDNIRDIAPSYLQPPDIRPDPRQSAKKTV